LGNTALLSFGRLRLVDAVTPEQELPVEVGDRYLVIVSQHDHSVGATAQSHQSARLQVLTAQSASPDHKGLCVEELLLDLIPVNFNLIGVSFQVELADYSIDWASGNCR